MCQPSPFDRQVVQALATKKFGDDYHADAGIVRFRRANPLRPGVAEVTDRRLRDPLVEFFIRMNPGHRKAMSWPAWSPSPDSNLTRAGLRMLTAGAQE